MSTAPSLPCCYADQDAPTFVETYDTTSSDWEFEYHSHADPDWEVQYISRGHASVFVEDEPCDLGAGAILIISPDQAHGCDASLGRRRVVTFRESSLRLMPFDAQADRSGALRVEGRTLPSRLAVPPRRRLVLESTLAQLERESCAREPMGHAMCGVLLAQFLLTLARTAPRLEAPSPTPLHSDAQATVDGLCAEVRASLGQTWTLDEMARRSGYSATQLCRLFERATSLSPCRWLRRERVDAARSLLLGTDMTVAQIAAEVGFQGRSQLHRVFREATGLTPAEYRDLLRPEV